LTGPTRFAIPKGLLMADSIPDQVKCPTCSLGKAFVVNQQNHLRPRPQTGNLQTDLKPISTTVLYKCQNKECGHEWNETTAAGK